MPFLYNRVISNRAAEREVRRGQFASIGAAYKVLCYKIGDLYSFGGAESELQLDEEESVTPSAGEKLIQKQNDLTTEEYFVGKFCYLVGIFIVDTPLNCSSGQKYHHSLNTRHKWTSLAISDL